MYYPNYMNNNISELPIIPLNAAELNGASGSNIPVIPLPNPGEGGPVAPGMDNGGNMPVIPLPNPGEGGPVGPGMGNGSNIPVIPLPNPGEGGPVAPNPGGLVSSIITVFPRPNIPCFFCNNGRSGNVRFLNAATGYNAFMIYVNNQLVVNPLNYAEISQYGRIASGFQTITVTGMNGYVYIQKPVQIMADGTMTIAIINTASGLDLTTINDVPCITPGNTACFRACNLSYNSGPLNVTMNNGYMVFSDIRYTEVTDFRRIQSGNYQFNVTRGGFAPMPRSMNGEVLVSSVATIRANSLYTMYIFNWSNSPDAIRTMIVEDRK